MNINTGLNPYNGSIINGADRTQMSQSQSLTSSPTDALKQGEVFEGSVNSIENGKVTIGLANGQTMTARLDSSVNLVPGQSVFFQVKSNDGSVIQLRPVSLDGLQTNPTLLKALDFANIAANERTINMVNSMMQNSMSINPENLAPMHRVLLNNPQVDVQTLVTMAKNGIEINPDNVNMFQNYANDKAVITDNFDTISDMLPELMTSKELTSSDVINLNSQLKEMFASVPQEGVEVNTQGIAQNSEATVVSEEVVVTNESQSQTSSINNSIEGQKVLSDASVLDNITDNSNLENAILDKAVVGEGTVKDASGQPNAEAINIASDSTEAKAESVKIVADEQNASKINISNENGPQLLNTIATEKQIAAFDNLLNKMPDFQKNNPEMFTPEGNLRADANIKEVFREVANYLEQHSAMPKDVLNDIIKTPLYKGMLKSLIADSFSLEPKDITKTGELSKLYERVMKQADALEKLISAFNGKAAEAIKTQTAEIKQNINFMNSANEMYNFVQIPLKMYNQNTDSMLYVRQNKKSSYEEGEEITAFLHFDMEHLGPTDIFVSLKETKVGCKWNLADDEALHLIESNIDILTERLAEKGYYMTSEMTTNEPKASFIEDFLGAKPLTNEPTSDGMVHRYSFDMRA